MSVSDPTTSRASSERTRAALVQAALRLFGERGFDATSTREIAAAANANIGSIAYHFGGKDALRDACAEHIVATVQAVAGPVLGQAPLPETPQAAEAQMQTIVGRMAGFLLAGVEPGAFVPFILREMQHPTRALDIIYSGVFEPVHRRLCQVWAIATGEEAESEAVRIAVFSMIGQIVYFRIGAAAVTRRMGWPAIGPEEATKVSEVAIANIEAVIASRRPK